MLEQLNKILETNAFMPHGHCYLWRSDILWLNVGSDAAIAASYFAIPAYLVYFVRRRSDLAYNWIFVMFALFIVACGATHLFEIWTVWNPQYGVQGLLKLFTAGVSVATAVSLAPLMPRALALPSSDDLAKSLREQARLNEELRRVNSTLELRVMEKTREIADLAAIVEHSSDAVIGKDSTGFIRTWNQAAERLFGYRADEVVGKSVYLLVPDSHRDEMDGLVRQVGLGETAKALDTVRVKKNGQRIDVSLTFSPIKDALGNIVGSSSIIHDITSRKESEVRLTVSEARKAAILNASLEAIVTIDHEGRVLEWNATAEKTFGYGHDEAVGRDMAELIVPERFWSAHREGLARYLKSGKGSVIGKQLEMPARRSNGEEFPLELSIGVIEGMDGPPLFTASARDITSRLRAEEALRKNEERFRGVIEAAPNGLLMVDQRGKVILCNTEFEKLFGYSRDEVIGRDMDFLVPERFRRGHPASRSGFFQSPVSRQMGAGRDLYGLRKDGTEVPVEIGLSPMVTAEGAFVLASIVDITKRKLLEDRIRHSAERIQLKNQEMEQFVYTVSHDLKSPLVTSTGFLGLLKEDIAAGRYDMVDESIERLERANGRMSQLIDDLLQLSRVGRITIDVEDVEVSQLVEMIVESLDSQVKEKSVVVKIQKRMPAIVADKKRLYQVLENLFINALKYGCDGQAPTIEVGAETFESEVRYYVRDSGPGIAKEYHQKIFGLFQRLENDNRGTGVGLTIVSRVMQLHGGRAWVESDVGSGATFWISFPKVSVASRRELEYE
ncbi:MAG: PAS domain S-box protein [Bdellovibrionaceae bacterium]|nr:PAS domain S-box protein [Pseudobdellovibrionaceae bacterium]